MKKTHIFAADGQNVDHSIPLVDPAVYPEGDPRRAQYERIHAIIDRLSAQYGTPRGGKLSINESEFRELREAVKGLPDTVTPGGSAANTLVALKQLLGDHIDVDFLSVAQAGEHTGMLMRDLQAAGINLIPKHFNTPGLAPEAAISYVFTEPSGARTIFKHPGNIDKLITPDMVTQSLIERCDVTFIQSALADKIHRKGWNDRKEKWLALPTQSKFSDLMPQKDYRFQIPSSDVVLSNHEELLRIYSEAGSLDGALTLLQADLARRDAIRRNEGKPARVKAPVGFVTMSGEGCAVVTPESIIQIPAAAFPHHTQPYDLGAGDVAYGGFLAGHIAGLLPKESAEIAMHAASAKREFPGRHPDLTAALRGDGPYNDKSSQETRRQRAELWNRLQEGLARNFGPQSVTTK